MMFMPFPILFSAAGGLAGDKPRTNGRAILGVIAVGSAIVVAALGYWQFGMVGLLAVPALAVLLTWSFAWGWLGVQCLDHCLHASGLRAGLFALGYAVSAAIGLCSLVGGMATFFMAAR